ncbi:RecF/RecN/SMC [Artemisia annua]|uniref:RecF/RecN/SMC n=1 Tax=Artemisia annua TaxID=35608 RepID=A0A2U1NMA0_ARTAN|nr:RecF/RecN/SMC [Artemisia annua]
MDAQKRLDDIHTRLVTKTSSIKDMQTKLDKNIPDLEKARRLNQSLMFEVTKEKEALLNLEQAARQKVTELKSVMESERNHGNVLNAILQAKASNAIQGIHGRLGDLGAINEWSKNIFLTYIIAAKCDVAISTACPGLDHILVETTDVANACVNILRKNNVGRGTFIVLKQQFKHTSRLKEKVSTPEGVPCLFDLIKVQDEKLKLAFFQVMGNTVVAKDKNDTGYLSRYSSIDLGRFFLLCLELQSKEMLNVRRSGRVSNRKRRNQGNGYVDVIDLRTPRNQRNEEEEVIDLTSPEWENVDEEFVNDEPVNDPIVNDEPVNDGQEKTGEDIKGDVSSHKVDNLEKVGKNDKPDAGEKEIRKAERKMGNRKLAALVEKAKGKQAAKVQELGERVASKRKLVKLAEKGKKQNGKASKGGKAIEADKGRRKIDDVENGDIRANEAGEADDDFVSTKQTKMRKVNVNLGNKDSAHVKEVTAGKSVAGNGENGAEGDKGKTKQAEAHRTDDVNVPVKECTDKVPTERIHQRNPPTNLFRVISKLSNEQKQGLREIGFGNLIEYKILDVPTRLAYWLLDKFDEETCSLDVNGKRIEITREVVRDVLGVPMGEVHVDARDGADFRNPLVLYAHSITPIKVWTSEALFKLEVDMFLNDDLGDADVSVESENDEFEEEEFSEDDMFAEYGKKHVPTDAEGRKKYVSSYLKKAAELVELADEVLDEELVNNPDDAGFLELRELRDALFAVRTYSNEPTDEKEENDYANYSFNTPENGGEPYPFTQVYGTPSGYGELSDQVCEEWRRKNEPIPTRLNFDEGEEFDLNVTQPPATQGKVVGGSDDDTPMEEVEGLLDSMRNYQSQEPVIVDEFRTPVHETRVGEQDCNTSNNMSRFGRESIQNESKAIVHSYTEAQPLNVLHANFLDELAKRRKKRTEKLRSPYVVREVSLVCGVAPHEKRATDCLFSARFPETDVVFKTSYMDGPRSVLESLYPGIDIATGAIDLFTEVLNDAEDSRNKYTPTRLFCHTDVLTSEMSKWEYDDASAKFSENMKTIVQSSIYSTLECVDMVFFPIIIGHHFILMCMNMKDHVVLIFDNIFSPIEDVRRLYGTLPEIMVLLFNDYLLHENHPKHNELLDAEVRIMKTGCRTRNNFVDCGVFVMRHMETYKGEHYGDCCGLSEEGKQQIKELRDLRIKYAAKILLADCNKVKKEFEIEIEAFRRLPPEEKERLEVDAFKKIKSRVVEMMGE